MTSGYKIAASHGQDGGIKSVMVQTPSGSHLISLTSILIGGSETKSWGDTYTGNNVTVAGNTVTLVLSEGFKMAVNKNGTDLELELVDISAISDQATGLLSKFFSRFQI